MDIQNDMVRADRRMLDSLSRGNAVVGIKQLKKALRAGRVQTAYFAADADPGVTEPIEALCNAQQVCVTWVKTMAELGRTCGIDVGAAAAATVKSS